MLSSLLTQHLSISIYPTSNNKVEWIEGEHGHCKNRRFVLQLHFVCAKLGGSFANILVEHFATIVAVKWAGLYCGAASQRPSFTADFYVSQYLTDN